MQKITQSLALDLVEVQHNVVNARQNDMLTRDLYITVTDKGNVYDNLPETAFAYLRGRRTDGKPVFYNVEIADRQNVLLHAELHDYLLCLPGRCKLDIGIYNRVQNENGIRNGTATPNQADEIASTDSFILYIPEEVFDETDVVESDEGSTLAKLINSARDEINEMNSLEERVTNNETKRESNEDTRKKQEEKRQEDTESAINRTNTAATSANTAAQTANNAAQTANAAATAANNAAGNANSAAENANNKAADLQQKLDSHHFALTEDLQSHNSSSTAHEDIRSLISGLTTRLNALADSDDTTLDQLSEIVAYIKNNKSLIDGVTTSKVSVSDIVDNLTSTATNKPLSAKQGKAVKDLIDALTTTVGNKVDKVSGKGLSANDFTTDEKNKLSGIASGAEVNVQSDWNVTDTTSDAYIKNKPTIPSAVAVKGNAESTYRTGNVNLTSSNIGAVDKSGDTMTGDLTIIKSANDVLVKTKRSDTGVQIRFGVGVDGIAHGLWSDPHNKWMIYADNTGIYVNGSAATIRETLPISKGGTGKTTGIEAVTALVDSLNAGSVAPTDADTYLASNAGYSSGGYCRRPMSYLWQYIKSKWDDIYNKKTHIGRGTFTGNVDNIKEAGAYWCTPASTGKPSETSYGLLVCETSDGESARAQTFYAYAGNGVTGAVYERTNTNNVWTPWAKPGSGVYLPLSGGTVTGDLKVNGKITQGYSTATGNNAVAFGDSCSASGHYAFATGSESKSGAIGTLAMGCGCNAPGNYGAAFGYATDASYFQTVLGALNRKLDGPPSQGAKSGTAFVIGNGTTTTNRSNAFRVTGAGAAYACSAFNSSGADYAEFFEWEDGNAGAEDRRGYFVTLSGDKIKLAEPGDYILGVVSAHPTVIGNSDEDWNGRYITDEFGSYIEETYEYDEIGVDENGEETTTRKTGVTWKENPDYDPNIPYAQRADRIEWDAVGMIGVLTVRDDGSCEVNGYCTAAEGGVATSCSRSASPDVYRVIERTGNHIVRIIVK